MDDPLARSGCDGDHATLYRYGRSWPISADSVRIAPAAPSPLDNVAW